MCMCGVVGVVMGGVNVFVDVSLNVLWTNCRVSIELLATEDALTSMWRHCNDNVYQMTKCADYFGIKFVLGIYSYLRTMLSILAYA